MSIRALEKAIRTHQLHRQRLLSRRHTTTHDRFTLRAKIEEQWFDIGRQRVPQRLAVDDDCKRSLGAGYKASFTRVQGRRT